MQSAKRAAHNADADGAADVPGSEGWRVAVAKEWMERRAAEPESNVLFPLAASPFGVEEVQAMVDVILSGRLTLGARVEAAEQLFARITGVKYAVMVNSGSSANLLAVAGAVNKLRPQHAEPGDEVLVPAVCWSTSVFPLLQNGLKPVFVDADPRTFNMSIGELEKRMNPRVKAVMAVHVLGNSTPMVELLQFVKKHNLILIEDTCESLGSFYLGESGQKRMLGTAGDFGTFSFYFSHHVTSGEGGMVLCKTEEDFNLIRCLRAHGWTRHLTNRAEVEASFPEVDPRFLFVNVGYNLRPMEVQGAMLAVQLRKLHIYNECRRNNLKRVEAALKADVRYNATMRLMSAAEGTDPAWFGISALLHEKYAHQLKTFLAYLNDKGIENRPVISGNFTRQPAIAAYCPDQKPDMFPGAETIHTRGFFVGVHQFDLEEQEIVTLVDLMLSFDFMTAS